MQKPGFKHAICASLACPVEARPLSSRMMHPRRRHWDRQGRRASHHLPAKRNTLDSRKPQTRDHIEYHKDGTIWAKGKLTDGVPDGYWEWLRKHRTIMRSGHFKQGVRLGEWITYDRNGEPYKVTTFEPKCDS
jgi:hypothetical protein